MIAAKLNIPVEDLAVDISLFGFGLDSVVAVDLTQALEERFGLQLDPSLFWELETIESIAKYISSKIEA